MFLGFINTVITLRFDQWRHDPSSCDSLTAVRKIVNFGTHKLTQGSFSTTSMPAYCRMWNHAYLEMGREPKDSCLPSGLTSHEAQEPRHSSSISRVDVQTRGWDSYGQTYQPRNVAVTYSLSWTTEKICLPCRTMPENSDGE